MQDPLKWFKRQTAPATVVLCALIVIGAFFVWSFPKLAVDYFAYDGLPFPKIWTLFTYPFLEGLQPIFLLLQVMWLYWVGTMLERDHGTRKFVYLWLAVSALGALAMTLMAEQLSQLWPRWQMIVGFVLIATVLFAPNGLGGLWAQWRGTRTTAAKEAA